MSNKQGSSSVPNALIKGGWDKEKSNPNGWTNQTTGEKLVATPNYVKKDGKGWENVSNKTTIR